MSKNENFILMVKLFKNFTCCLVIFFWIQKPSIQFHQHWNAAAVNCSSEASNAHKEHLTSICK